MLSDESQLDIIKKICYDDPRVIVINKRNEGLIQALNDGIAISKGLFIARMDADDISNHSRLDLQINYLKSNNLDICGCNIELFGDKTGYVKYPVYDDKIKLSLILGSPFAHPSIMIKASILKKNMYDAQAVNFEDFELWSRLAMLNYSFGNINESLLNYRVHSNQISCVNRIKQVNGAVKIKIEYAKFLINNFNFDYHSNVNDISSLTFFILRNKNFFYRKGLRNEFRKFIFSFLPYTNINKIDLLKVLYLLAIFRILSIKYFILILRLFLSASQFTKFINYIK